MDWLGCVKFFWTLAETREREDEEKKNEVKHNYMNDDKYSINNKKKSSHLQKGTFDSCVKLLSFNKPINEYTISPIHRRKRSTVMLVMNLFLPQIANRPNFLSSNRYTTQSIDIRTNTFLNNSIGFCFCIFFFVSLLAQMCEKLPSNLRLAIYHGTKCDRKIIMKMQFIILRLNIRIPLNSM